MARDKYGRNRSRGWILNTTYRAFFARDSHDGRPENAVCAYCGEPAATLDHLTPRNRGGVHRVPNIVAACTPCNSAKRDLTLDEFLHVRYPGNARKVARERKRIRAIAKGKIEAHRKRLAFEDEVERALQARLGALVASGDIVRVEREYDVEGNVVALRYSAAPGVTFQTTDEGEVIPF